MDCWLQFLVRCGLVSADKATAPKQLEDGSRDNEDEEVEESLVEGSCRDIQDILKSIP